MRNHLLSSLALLSLIACSDRADVTGTRAPDAPTLPAVARDVTVTGALIQNPSRSASPFPYGVLDHDGNMWWLTGSDLDQLASGYVTSAEIEVRGTLIDASGIAVQSFFVLAVDGVPVSDGILEIDDSIYALRLSDGGLLRALVDPPEELKGLVGARVWISGAYDEAPRDFGIISRNPEAPSQDPSAYRLRAAGRHQ